MSPEARRQEIVTLVMRTGTVQLDELVDHFRVSRMTIHRDLDLLESRGLLRKERGTATAESSLLFESNYHYRIQVAVAEKKALARAARQLIEPGNVIMIDDSTTTLFLTDALEDIDFLTVITNSFAVCERLRGRPNIQLIATGGIYNDTTKGFYGLVCEQTIAKMRADWAFLSSPAIIGTSLYHQDQEVVRMKRALMASSERRALLVVQRKFASRALNHFADLSEFDRVFIAGGLDEPVATRLRQAGIPFDLVPTGKASTCRE